MGGRTTVDIMSDDDSTNCPGSDDEGDIALGSDDNPGEQWERHVESHQPSNYNYAMTAPIRVYGDEDGERVLLDVLDPVPAMPTILTKKKHRAHIPERRDFPFNALVARKVSKKEIENEPKAQKAVKQEWDRLRSKNCWDEDEVYEWSEVANWAKSRGEEHHFGHLFCITVEKNSELPQDNPNRKYKGRVVFQGNQVKDQNWDVALFQDLGSNPATMDASRAADCYGCAPGHNVEVADAEQAYIQADLRGPPTWVCLPRDAWPEKWIKKGFRNPVCRLKKALYGHPDSGTFWEEHCENTLRA
mgnify:FL=1